MDESQTAPSTITIGDMMETALAGTRWFTQADGTRWFTQASGTRWFTQAAGTRWFSQAAGTRWFSQASGTRWFSQAAGTRWFSQAAGTRWFSQAAGTRWFSQAAGTRWFSQAAGTRWFTSAVLALVLAMSMVLATVGSASFASSVTGGFQWVDVGHEGLRQETNLYAAAVRSGIDQSVAATGQGVTIALVDTGVAASDALAHSTVAQGPDFSGEGTDGIDRNGHGTHLAGILVGTDAAWAAGDHSRRPGRELGIAPGATLLNVRAGNAAGTTEPAAVLRALQWITEQAPAAGHQVDVVVLAYGVPADSPAAPALNAAVQRAVDAGIVVVAAAGNSGDAGVMAPAANPDVIAVGATEGVREVRVAGFSTRGTAARQVDVVAPGRSIVSARAVGSTSDEHNALGRVGTDRVAASGTSQSAAITGGLAALLLEERPALTPAQVKQALTRSARDIASAPAAEDGHGVVDAAAALAAPVDVAAAPAAAPADATGLALTGTMAPLGSTWLGSTWLGSTWLGSTWLGSTWLGSTWLGSTWLGSTWLGSTWLGSTWLGSTWLGSTWLGSTWLGSTWLGSTWLGSTWLGSTWLGSTWLGSTWLGSTWLGSTWLGSTWLGSTWLGSTWLGSTWLGSTWLGSTWLGSTWLGSTWLGSTWLGSTWLGSTWL